MLQWGHRSIAVEGSEIECAHFSNPFQLQWGHRSIAVEGASIVMARRLH